MNKLILVFIFTLTLCATALAQSNFTDNTFVITTYYPAPYGVYRNMRLQPSDLPSAGVGPGVMYYNQTENMMKFFNNTTWVNMTGGGSAGGGGAGSLYACRPAGYTYDTTCSFDPSGQKTECPIFKDCDGDGKTYVQGDCDETCPTCYAGYTGNIYTADGKDNDCNGKIDEAHAIAPILNSASGQTCAALCSAKGLPACYSAGEDVAGKSGAVMRQGGSLPGCWPTAIIGTPGGACNFVITDRTTYCPDSATCAASYTENWGCTPGSGLRTDWLYCQCGNPSFEGLIY